MNTTTAATQANVTIATIRTWCRNGVITATKTAGRWIIDTASLAHRITIGTLKTHKKATPVNQLPIVATARTSIPGIIGVIGPADTLAAALQTGAPVTLSRKYDGEQVYLGHTHTTYDDGLTTQIKGLDADLEPHPQFPDTPRALYLIDMTRLDNAPTIRAGVEKAHAASLARAAKAEADAAAAEARVHLNTSYDD